jgi:hypothetical protein
MRGVERKGGGDQDRDWRQKGNKALAVPIIA